MERRRTSTTLRIDSKATLERALHQRPPRRVEIDTALLSKAEGAREQQVLNKHLADCGCAEASFALLTAVLLLTALIVLVPLGQWWMRAIVVVVGASLVMALVKSLAQRRARRRYYAELASLLTKLEG
jgi:Flp pilus assembly protein TadB